MQLTRASASAPAAPPCSSLAAPFPGRSRRPYVESAKEEAAGSNSKHKAATAGEEESVLAGRSTSLVGMEERSSVTAATGALGPVLQRLNSLLGDENRVDLQGSCRSDIEFIKDKLEPMHSRLARIWGRADVDSESKYWMTEVRELSYVMEDAMDSFVAGLDLECGNDDDDDFIQQQKQQTNRSPFQEFRKKVEDLSVRCPSRGVLKTLEAMAAATGTLGLVLAKLTALLGDGDKIQEGTTQSDLEFIKSELEAVHYLLPKIWDREVLDAGFKQWMLEAEELSDKLKSAMDSFMLELEWGDVHQLTITSGFEEVKRIASDMSARCRDKFSKCSRSPMNPRARFLHKDASELVGMEKKKDELIGLLLEGDQGESVQMVCIVGPAGIGKTTLADLVYNAVVEQFQCRAFVSVSLSPDMVQVLSMILREVTNGVQFDGTEAATEQHFIDIISNFLADKRYLVVVDDIWHWEEWEIIRKALPKNNMGSKIIMTTRMISIAEKCESEQGSRKHTHNFGYEDSKRLADMRLNNAELSAQIADMCGDRLHDEFCPLAVICLSSAWAESHVQGDYLFRLGICLDQPDMFLSTPSLEPLVHSFRLYLDDLPVHLRTCLLYCSIYRRTKWFGIDRYCLVRKWIAEGFVSQEEVAEAYFDELVSRNLLRFVRNRFSVVYPIMLDFLVCIAKEDSFVACGQYNGPGSSSDAKQIPRISLYKDRTEEDDVSHIRSLSVRYEITPLDGVPFKKFQNLRVLEIESCEGLENGHLVDICGLTWLRYLGLSDCRQITELPREIGRLQNLETLDVSFTCISKLPMEIEKLQHLDTLDVSNTMVRELPKEIGKLKHLRILDIRTTKVRELPGREVPNSFLSVISYIDLDSGKAVKLPLGIFRSSGDEEIISSSEANCREGLSILVLFNHVGRRFKVIPVLMHRVAGRHMSLPQWVKQDLHNVSSLDIGLLNLGEDDLEFLKQMPNLQALELRLEVLPRKPIDITGGGFSRLETFYVDCRLPRVTFQSGAMPKLKYLEFKFYAGRSSQGYSMGIQHLPELEKVVFRSSSEYYTSDDPGINAIIDVVREEAAEHPNKEITFWVNDDMVFGGTWAGWLSRADKTIRERRNKLYTAAAGRDRQNKYRVPWQYRGPWHARRV